MCYPFHIYHISNLSVNYLTENIMCNPFHFYHILNVSISFLHRFSEYTTDVTSGAGTGYHFGVYPQFLEVFVLLDIEFSV